jgi:hypothetical protein
VAHRLITSPAVAASVEALAGKIDRDRRAIPIEMNVDADIVSLYVNGRPLAEARSSLHQPCGASESNAT